MEKIRSKKTGQKKASSKAIFKEASKNPSKKRRF